MPWLLAVAWLTFPFLFVSQTKTILSVLLREYTIELIGDVPPPDFEALMLGPKGKCNIRYTKRNVSC